MGDDKVIASQEKTASIVVQKIEPELSLKKWMFDRVKQFVTERVLEIGAGNGFIAPVCLQNGVETDVMPIDLSDKNFNYKYKNLWEHFNTVFLVNKGHKVIENKLLAINCAKLLKQRGFLMIQIPAQTALFCGLDQGFENWKNYNEQFIDKLLRKEFKIIKTRYLMVNSEQVNSISSVSKYYERVAVFSKLEVHQDVQFGLSILLAVQKR